MRHQQKDQMGPTVETHKYINRQTTTEAVGACETT